MRKKLLCLTFLLTLLIPVNTLAGSAVYLPFSIQGGSDQSTAFNNSIVASNDAHWGWTYRWWTSTGPWYNRKYTLNSETRHDGIVLGGKTTDYNKTLHTTSDNDGNAFSWADKYIIIESKEVIGSIQLVGDVYSSIATAQSLKSFWYVYVTNDINNWGDYIWDGDSKSINTTINLTAHPNYENLKKNKYVVICYRGNYSAYLSKVVIKENTYFNITSTPDDYSVFIGEYQTQDIAVDFSNLDGINNTGITEFTVTSTDPAFECQSQSGDPLGLLKSGQHQIAIRFYPENDKVPTKHETTITIKAGTKSNSPKKTINLIGYSYKPQTIIWNQNFSRLDISDADIPLTATSSVGLTPIVYTSNNPSIVTIINGKLHIVGKGRTTITASQAGRDGYSPATKTKYVYVSEPGDPCETYDLYEPDHVTLHTIDAEVYELFGLPADKLTFDACRTIDAITSSFGNQYFWVAESTDGGKNFHDIRYIDDMPRSESFNGLIITSWKNYTVQLSENATHVKIYTKTGATMRHHIRNVIVTQKPYIRTNPNQIELTPEVGSSNYSSTVRVSYSALKENLRASFKTSTSQFTLDHTNIPVGCGEADIVDIKISMPNVSCNELRNYLVLTDGTTTVEVPIIVTPQKGFQQINWFDSNVPTEVNTSSELTVADMGAYVAPRNIQPVYTSDNPEIADFDAYGNLVIKQPGNVTIRASRAEEECYKAADDVTKTINIAQAYLTFDDKSKDKNWFNANNWKPNRNVIPNHLAFATLEADAEIDGTAIAVAKKLDINSHRLTVKADGNLHADNIINADTEEPLIALEAGDRTHAPGALATQSSNVTANVGIFVMSTTNSENTTWQYFGVPFALKAIPAFYGAWVCEWSEAAGSWSYKKTSDILQPWTGYCITQPNLVEYYGHAIDGKVQTGNHTYTLQRTEGSSYIGNNIITNSYTAPIDITKLEDGDFVNVEKTIYIYNTGSYKQWEEYKNNKAISDAAAGQYFAIPIKVADYTPYGITVIPAMQAFCLMAQKDGATFTVDYQRTIFNSKANTTIKRAPRRIDRSNEDNEENLIINIHGSRFSDAISILKRRECSELFDDGYDAAKLEGNNLAPRLYSIEDNDKIYAIDTRHTLDGHYIGLDKGEDDTYTISFPMVDTEDLLFLKDLSDNSYYPIIEGMEIEIEALNSMSRRFQIVSEISDDEGDKPSGVVTDIRMTDESAVLTNVTDNMMEAAIIDMTGKLVHRETVAPRATLDYNVSDLPHGTYIICFGDKRIKIAK